MFLIDYPFSFTYVYIKSGNCKTCDYFTPTLRANITRANKTVVRKLFDRAEQKAPLGKSYMALKKE